MNDLFYMNRAIELAKQGEGAVNPNPLVGAVIVKNGKIIGEGYHKRYGQLHAERNAINKSTEALKGSTLYVTLEPCCHYGKTPPCTEAIIENQISRVVIGTLDPNPKMSGKSVKILKDHGISVDLGINEYECKNLIKPFSKYILTKRPYVVMKYAMTLDGKIATHTGHSKWITGIQARRHVHQSRNKYTGIMVGINTVLKDDPSLTCRIENGRNPIRIICDSWLKTPLTSKVVTTAKDVPTLIATCVEDSSILKPFKDNGVQILTIPEKNGHLNLKYLMKVLGEKKIDSILLEGGGTLNWSALNEKIVDKVQVYISPKLFGGLSAPSPIGGDGIAMANQCFELKNSRFQIIGRDYLIESEVKY